MAGKGEFNAAGFGHGRLAVRVRAYMFNQGK